MKDKNDHINEAKIPKLPVIIAKSHAGFMVVPFVTFLKKGSVLKNDSLKVLIKELNGFVKASVVSQASRDLSAVLSNFDRF